MGVRVRWEGLDDLRAALRALPTDLAKDARGIIMTHVEAAKRDIYAAYPMRTGNLREGLRIVEVGSSGFGSSFKVGSQALGAGAILYNAAPHAYMYENGTVARQTAIGAKRGSQRPGHVFIPRVIRHRKAMYDALAVMMQSHGLLTTRHAA